MNNKLKHIQTEVDLVRRGRRLIREALQDLEGEIKTRYEVPAPGAIPDLVLFYKRHNALQYVITVEFKLHNWQRAIAQAFRHRNFGNESYVILDQARSASAVRKIDLFKSTNIGLITVNSQNNLLVWHYPSPELPFSPHFSRQFAKSLLPSTRKTPFDLPYIRSIRGGVALADLRHHLGTPQVIAEAG